MNPYSSGGTPNPYASSGSSVNPYQSSSSGSGSNPYLSSSVSPSAPGSNNPYSPYSSNTTTPSANPYSSPAPSRINPYASSSSSSVAPAAPGSNPYASLSSVAPPSSTTSGPSSNPYSSSSPSPYFGSATSTTSTSLSSGPPSSNPYSSPSPPSLYHTPTTTTTYTSVYNSPGPVRLPQANQPSSSPYPPSAPSHYADPAELRRRAAEAAEAERLKHEYAEKLSKMEADLARAKQQQGMEAAQREEERRKAAEAQNQMRRLQEEQERMRMLQEEKLRMEQAQALRAMEADFANKMRLQQQQVQQEAERKLREEAAAREEQMRREKYESDRRAQEEVRLREELLRKEQQEKLALQQQLAMQQQQLQQETERRAREEARLREELQRKDQMTQQQMMMQQEVEKRAREEARLREEMVRREQMEKMALQQQLAAQQQQLAQESEKRSREEARLREELQKKEMYERQLQQQQQQLQAKQQQQQRTWDLSVEDVKLERKLGEGAFGEVWLGRLHGKAVACKKIRAMQGMSPEILKAFEEELDVMSRLRHPNILLFMGASLKPQQMMLVTEFMSRGSLAQVLHNPQETISFPMKMRFARDISAGMAWLHAQKPPIVHRDLKPENCLVNHNWTVCVSDFGIAQVKALATTQNSMNASKQGFGSPFYMAPELLLDKDWDRSVDVYAFGITLWEIMARRTPFEDCESFQDLVDTVAIDNQRPPRVQGTPDALWQVMQGCWAADFRQRPTFTDLLNGCTFDILMINHLAPEPTSNTFWRHCFLQRTPNDVVPFNELMLAFGGCFQVNPLPPPEDVRVQCLRALVASDNGQQVTLEDFGRSMRFFAPFGPQALLKMKDTLSAGWFHGPVTKQQAESTLVRNKKAGSYLIRYGDANVGEDEMTLVLSILQEGGHTQHMPIALLPEGKGYVLSNQQYATLDELLMKSRRPLALSVPCIGSKFDSIQFPDE